MMEGVFSFNSKPVFKNQPILCPWVSRQPYPSSQHIKSKLCSLEKRREAILNSGSSSRRTAASTSTTTSNNEPETSNTPRSNNSHFFYFLRLMQLFPETHPATLHAVLTACKSNFFYAIGKLLYAQKCKNALGMRSRPVFKNKIHVPKPRLNLTVPRHNPQQRGQFITKSSTNIENSTAAHINIVDKPFQVDANDMQQPALNMVNICLNADNNQTGQQSSYVQDDRVIEIVCYENEHQNVKTDDAMEIETFGDNLESIEPTIGDNLNMHHGEDNDAHVIVVETSQESDDVICINNGGTTLEAISNQTNNNNSAENANLCDIGDSRAAIVELD